MGENPLILFTGYLFSLFLVALCLPLKTWPSYNSVVVYRDERVSNDTINIIRKLLVLNPENRYTASQVLVALTGIIDKW